MLRVNVAAFILGTSVLFAAPGAASENQTGSGEPGWLGVVVARGELKQQIEATPIEDRPNRPFHFYGNTVRRRYYRGAAAPRPSDFAKGGAALIQKRD